MGPNFQECGDIFRSSKSQLPNPFAQWSYEGPIWGVLGSSPQPTVITYEGCLALCGEGYQLYAWVDIANTITTWVLPVVGGLLLQAPFESNKTKENLLALNRWIGSPMSSLSCVLWNIKVTGKCALMVDMATPYDDVPSDESSEFSRMRDSFYILAVMNQFGVDPAIPDDPAEKLLRRALFSDTLRPGKGNNEQRDISKMRQTVARRLRHGRRRGVVPVFISAGWFLCSLAISIEMAFGNLGRNATAHNLALGLLLGFVPVFVLSSIADRNPVSTSDIRLQLNDLLSSVRAAIIEDEESETTDLDLVQTLQNDELFLRPFFSDFAGQGRSRWHYGVTHPILAGIEDAYVAKKGRNWLQNPRAARAAMIKGPDFTNGIHWFDWREIWQILSAVTIVVGTIMGAFTISYFTPTPGLGCRSGGYMIFTVMAFASLLIEMATWWLTSIRSTVFSRSLRSRVDRFFLSPLDLVNTCWLIYIVAAQTSGLYRTCACMSSLWGGQGGYIDFESMDLYKEGGIALYWGIGTGVSLLVLTTAALFIMAEWCSQSHISTVDYRAASQGLKWARRWKYYTTWAREAPSAVVDFTIGKCRAVTTLLTKHDRPRFETRSLVWSAQPRTQAPSTSNQEDVELARLIGRERSRDHSTSSTSTPNPITPPLNSHLRAPSLGTHPNPSSSSHLTTPRSPSMSRSRSGSESPSSILLQLSPTRSDPDRALS